ncbi:MAG: hypothetical protein LBE38_00980 [Deltaproteobacteria bacterium]|jgi:hypothetical protein|nr:hypothetical protein [Deltaproteobacteria bacterium]
MARTTIYVCSIQDNRLDGFEGIKLIHRYGLLSDLLKNELSADRADFLAEPIESPEEGVIYWYTSLEGEVKRPEQLNNEEVIYAKELMNERISELSNLSQKLLASSASNLKHAGTYLEKIVRGQEFWQPFMVGDRLVICGWGLEPISPLPLRRNLLSEDSADPIAFTRPITPYVGPIVAAPPPLPLAPLEPVAKRRFPWLPFLLFLLLPLFLLFLILLLLYPEFYGLEPWGWSSDQVLVAEEDDREAELRDELWLLRQQYYNLLLACPANIPPRVPDATYPPIAPEIPDTPDTQDTPDTPVIPVVPDVGGVGSWSGGVDELPPSTDENTDVLPEVLEDTPLEDEVPPFQETPFAADTPAGDTQAEQVQIPQGAQATGDVSWLEGCWTSKSNLYNERTQAPLLYTYCFNENGRANVRIEERDANGNLVESCLTVAQAQMLEGRLVIDGQGIPICEEGGSYRSANVVCTPGEEDTECVIEQDGLEGHDNFQFSRMQ